MQAKKRSLTASIRRRRLARSLAHPGPWSRGGGGRCSRSSSSATAGQFVHRLPPFLVTPIVLLDLELDLGVPTVGLTLIRSACRVGKTSLMNQYPSVFGNVGEIFFSVKWLLYLLHLFSLLSLMNRKQVLCCVAYW